MIANSTYYLIMNGIDQSCTRTSVTALKGRRVTDLLASKIFLYRGRDGNRPLDRLAIVQVSQSTFFSVINCTGVAYTHLKDSSFPQLASLMSDISLRVRFTSADQPTNTAILKHLRSFGELKIVSLSSSKGLNDWHLRVNANYYPKTEGCETLLLYKNVVVSLEFEEDQLSDCSYDMLGVKALQGVTLHESKNTYVLQADLQKVSREAREGLSIQQKQGTLYYSGTTNSGSNCLEKPLSTKASELPRLSARKEDSEDSLDLKEGLPGRGSMRGKVASLSAKDEASGLDVKELRKRIEIHTKTLEGCTIYNNVMKRISCKTSPDMDEAERLLIEAKIMRSKIKRMKRKMKGKRKNVQDKEEEGDFPEGKHLKTGSQDPSDEDVCGYQATDNNYCQASSKLKDRVGNQQPRAVFLQPHLMNHWVIRGNQISFGGLSSMAPQQRY